MPKNIMITGSAGFIGYHLAKKLLTEDIKIIGIDNLNNYYSTDLKRARLKILNKTSTQEKGYFHFINENLENKFAIDNIFKKYRPEIVIHLAAQAGVSYSLDNPSAYINSNLVGFLSILEGCRNNSVKTLLYASSSSVYGGNIKTPYCESDQANHPISLYAATKRSNELMAHSYSHLFNISCTGLRFFTVYGPWGRPDMAPMIFTKAILNNDPIKVFNNGKMSRDFTFIDDIVEAIEKILKKPATKNKHFNQYYPDPSTSWAPHRIFNIGNNNPVNLLNFIEIIEEKLGIKANKILCEERQGDVKDTFADLKNLYDWIEFKPKVKLEIGIEKLTTWFKKYYGYEK